MKFSKTMGRLVQIIISRLLKVESVGRKSSVQGLANFDGDHKKKLVQHTSELITNVSNGTINAVYGFRFVPIPFDYYVAIMLDKGLEDVNDVDRRDISSTNQLSSLEGIDFAEQYKKLNDNFIHSYQQRHQKRPNDQIVSVLEEEFFHHTHVKDTSTWLMSNLLTLCYRVAATYVCFRSYKKKRVDLEASKLAINAYFMQWYLSMANSAIIEAYKHYSDEDLQSVRENYGQRVYEFCLTYKELEQVCSEKFADISKDWNIIDYVSKLSINFPFASKIKAINTNHFLSIYSPFVVKERFEKALRILSDEPANAHSSQDVLQNKLQAEIETAEGAELNISKNFIFYATRKFMPSQLVWFIAWRIVVIAFTSSKYFYVAVSFLMGMVMGILRGGKKIKSNSYSTLPAIQTSGLNGEDFTVDFAMKLFEGNPKYFKKAAESFEPTFLGDKSKKNNIGLSNHQKERFRKLLIHKAFLRAVFYAANNRTLDDYLSHCLFSFQWAPFLAKSRNYIVEHFLNLLYHQASEMIEGLDADFNDLNVDPIDDQFVHAFHQRLHEIESTINQLEGKDVIYWYADAIYRHGI